MLDEGVGVWDKRRNGLVSICVGERMTFSREFLRVPSLVEGSDGGCTFKLGPAAALMGSDGSNTLVVGPGLVVSTRVY